MDLDDNALIALGLREHAQTCDEIAAKHPHDNEQRRAWLRRADRCRDLATRYTTASKPRTLA